MLLKESEAKVKSCINWAIAGKDNSHRCIGSRCMAWRWMVEDCKLGCCGLVYPNMEDAE